VGINAQATGANAIAIGSGAVATGSVAVGTGATASNGGSAFGDYATATGTASVAAGEGATSIGSNSVAIGSKSTDGGQSNVVSVGSAGSERRITNVAAGVNDTDAVNFSQLNTSASNTLTSANAYTDSRINDLSHEVHRGVAGAIAMSRALIPLNPGETGVAVGVGTSRGEGAVAVSLQHYVAKRVHLNIGASFSGSDVQAGGGIGIKF
jgi:autotransporter adhesin